MVGLRSQENLPFIMLLCLRKIDPVPFPNYLYSVNFVVRTTPTFVSFGEMFWKLSGSVVQGHKANSRAHKKLSSFFQLLAQYV